MRGSRPVLTVFRLVIVVPAFVGILAFSSRWGLGGFLCGVMMLANTFAVLSLFRYCTWWYVLRIFFAWLGAFAGYATLISLTVDNATRIPDELWILLVFLGLGWGGGWGLALYCEILFKEGNSTEGVKPGRTTPEAGSGSGRKASGE